jgi:hypothetical protein
MNGPTPLIAGDWHVDPTASTISVHRSRLWGLRESISRIDIGSGHAQVRGDESVSGGLHLIGDNPVALYVNALTETLPGCARLAGELAIGDQRFPVSTGTRVRHLEGDVVELHTEVDLNGPTTLQARVVPARSGPPGHALSSHHVEHQS